MFLSRLYSNRRLTKNGINSKEMYTVTFLFIMVSNILYAILSV